MSDDALSPVKPRLAISKDQAQAIVERVAPGSSAAGITELRGGEIGAVFEIVPTNSTPFILKIYPVSLHWKMAKEVQVLGRLRDSGVPVPRILLSDDTRSVIDMNFVLMSKLGGTVLGQRESALSEAELRAIYREMGASLRAIHGIMLDSFGYIGPDGVWTAHNSNRAYMSFQFNKKLTEFSAHGGDPALAKRLRGAVGARQHLFDQATTPRLCHYDFHAGNVLVTPSGTPHLTGIVDFENAIAGDPLLDIAKAIYYLKPQDALKRAGLLEGYGEIDRPEWQQTLDLYQLYCALELWCWFAQIGRTDALAGLTADLARAG